MALLAKALDTPGLERINDILLYGLSWLENVIIERVLNLHVTCNEDWALCTLRNDLESNFRDEIK